MTEQPEGAFVHRTAVIDTGASVGTGTTVWANTHLRSSARVGAYCTIGERVYIDVDVQIGDRCKVQNQAMIFGPALIGDGCFIGPGACLTNDRLPRAIAPDGTIKGTDDWDAAGVTVAEGASIGAMATVVSGVSIGAWALVGAGAVVTRDVPDHTMVVGIPAKPGGLVCRCARPLDADLSCSAGHSFERSGNSLTPIAR